MAVTLAFVSKPLAEDMLKRARKANDFREVRQLQRDLAQIEELIQSTRKKAMENRAKAAKDEQGIDLEKKRIESYIDSFLQHYPHAMVSTWGLEKMRRRADGLRRKGDVKEALAIERRHWDKCADWYEATCLKYYKMRNEKKSAHFQEVVSLLRKKAGLYRKKAGDRDLDIRQQLSKIDESLRVAQAQPHNLSLDKAIEIVRKDPRMSRLKTAKFSGWWQGAYWCVMIHRGNREAALVTVADETGKVLDINLRD